MIQISDWAHTALGTPIELYSSHTLEEMRRLKPILLMGGIHGDEPLGVHLAQKTLQYLLTDAKKTQPWILVPILNVDGFRKNTRTNGRGVDLNRNYPARSWDAKFENERYNPGTAPGSEPEIQAVVRLIDFTAPRLIIHCHSWHPMIICAGEPGLPAAESLSRSSGYEVKPEIGYPTPGSLSQFGWVDRSIPIICIEEDDHTPQEKVWPNFANGMAEIFTGFGPVQGT